MSNPAQNAATPENPGQEKAQPTFQDRVNEAVSTLTEDDSGNFNFPEDIEMTSEVKVAAIAEKRRRDTQSALAKSKNREAILAAENEELKKFAMQQKNVSLSEEEQDELDKLKFSDPDAWRQKMNELEQTATTQVSSKLSEISENAKASGTLGERQVLLEAFKIENPGFEINDSILENDIPPRITKKLEIGEVTFTEFLTEVRDYLLAGKTIANAESNEGPNLTDVGGSDTPTEQALDGQSETDYENAIF